MKKILVGYIGRGKTSGIDKYLFLFLRKMKEEGNKVDFLTRDEDNDLSKYIDYNDSKVFKVSRNRHFFKQLKEMKKIIRENNYDIGYFNISEAYNFVGILAAKLYGIKKVVVHSHSSGLKKSSYLKTSVCFILNYLLKFVITLCSDLNIACSEKAAKWLFSKNVYDNDDYEIIYNAVDYEKFKYNEKTREKIRKKYKIDDKFVVGHVGRFTFVKNHGFLIDIFCEYHKKNPNSVLMCIGDGVDFERIKEYSKKIGVYDNIIFTGSVENVNEMIQAFDCFLLPSKFEGLPVVGIESQFSQTKCIFSDRISRLASISDSTLFLPINDPKKWANSITGGKAKLNKNAENFKVENVNDQFNKIVEDNSGKIDVTSLLLKLLLIIHYFLNLTVFYNGFNYLMIACGILLLIITFSKKFKFIRTKLKEKKINICYMLFLISYLLSFALMKKYDVVGSAKILIWTILHMFYAFNTSYFINKNSLKRETSFIFKAIIFVLSIINVHNLYLLLNRIQTTTISFGNKVHLVGLTKWGRFYGNFYDANYASVSCVCAMFMAIYLIKRSRKSIEKILLSISIMLDLIYLYIGQSRTGLVAFAISFATYILVSYLLPKINFKKLIVSLFLFFICIFALPKQFLNTYNNFSKAMSEKEKIAINTKNDVVVIENDKLIEEVVEEPVEEQIHLGRTDYGDDFSNGRLDIWQDGLKIFNKNKIFGIGFANILAYSKENFPELFVSKNNFEAFHNVLVDLLVSQGIVGIIIALMMFVYFAVLTIRNYSQIKSDSEVYEIFKTIVSIIASIFVSSLFLSQIFYINNFVTFAFWLLMGYYYFILIDCNKKNKSEV